MRLWTGRIEDCLLAPNGEMYYTCGEKIGKTSALGNDVRLPFQGAASWYKAGPLDFVRQEDAEGYPRDLVVYAGRSYWAGFLFDTLEPVKDAHRARSPIGGDSYLVSTVIFIGVRLDRLDQSYPLHVHPVCLDSSQAGIPWHVFDDDNLVVAVPYRGSDERVQLVHADRNDLRRTSPLMIEGHTVFERARWTRDYMVVYPVSISPRSKTQVFGVRPDGTFVSSECVGTNCVLGFTPGGQPVYCETRPKSRGVFVGDRHYDFGLDGPTRGAVVSADGNTAAYWTVRNVVQFDLE